MKRSFQRLAALLLACLTLASSAALAAEDYTVAEKLLKQLWAGSGFSGELTVSFDTPALRTKQPIRADWDYIYVRPTEQNEAEHRVDIRLENGSAASVQLMEGSLAFQADLISPDWYVLRADSEDEPADASAAAQALQSGANTVLSLTGMPEVSRTALALAARLSGSEAVQDALEPYKTRVDVWIEGYREDALLDKLDDGTTTMEVNYRVSPAAIKAQVKQMTLDMLADAELLTALTDAMGEEAAQRYVNPALQSWYFSAVDALPLSDDLTISRTFSLKGDTLSLSLCLPLYDAQTGAVVLSYDRVRGQGDLPDENVIHLESEQRTLEMRYQEYSSMTGVKVLQGRVENRASESFEVDGSAAAPANFAADFTLKQEQSETRDSEGRDVYAYNLNLTLQPEEGEEIEASLTSRFASKELKSAATEADVALTLRRGQSSVSITANGTSRKKWEPDPLPFERTDLASLTQADLTATLAGAGVRLLAAVADCVETPEAAAEPSEAPEATPTEAPAETEAPTEAPTDAPTEAPTEAPTDAPTEAPTEAPTDAPASTANP